MSSEREPGPLRVVERASPLDTVRLIEMLDPERDYGKRSYQEVVDGIRTGVLLIEEGQRLPVLREAASNQAIRGTGNPPQKGMNSQQAALWEYRARAVDDLPEAYDLLMKGMRGGDPRFQKIYWENLLGKMGEARGTAEMAEAFKALIEAMKVPAERRIVLDG